MIDFLMIKNRKLNSSLIPSVSTNHGLPQFSPTNPCGVIKSAASRSCNSSQSCRRLVVWPYRDRVIVISGPGKITKISFLANPCGVIKSAASPSSRKWRFVFHDWTDAAVEDRLNMDRKNHWLVQWFLTVHSILDFWSLDQIRNVWHTVWQQSFRTR